MKSFIASISAEILKLKGTYVWWLCALIIAFIGFVIFIGHFLDVNNLAQFGSNPWNRISSAGEAMFSVFIIGLFVTLLTGASGFIENRANGWKMLYSYPVRRIQVFYAKLLSYVIILFMVALTLTLILVIDGYLLDFLRPEYEFRYYQFDLNNFISSIVHSLISALGILGIHYFLSLFFKNFIIPIGIGVVGFILGLILGAMNTPRALFCPYSYPMVVKDFGMFRIDQIGIVDHGWLNSVEINSIVVFVVFILLAKIIELRRNVKG